MNRKLSVLLLIFLISLSLSFSVNATHYNNYDLSDPRSIDLESSLRVSERESFERSENFERIEQSDSISSNRFLSRSPRYYDRVYYNRGNIEINRYVNDFSRSSTTSIVRYQRYEKFDRSLNIDRVDRDSRRFTNRPPTTITYRGNRYRGSIDNFDNYDGMYYPNMMRSDRSYYNMMGY